MHYSNLNNGGNKEDEFRPQDFLDLDSGDSDNEVLAKFKPEAEKRPMIGLLQPPSPMPIRQFGPPSYQVNGGSQIDEQTGYSNSPKFSIYRLNNQSQMKDGQNGFEDQMNNIGQQHDLQSQNHNLHE